MPDIELIPVPLYDPLDVYHHVTDNRPLRGLIDRQEVMNSSLDDNSEILREAAGTQGTLANRLSQSLEEDGSLKLTAIDAALHSIEAHEDTVDFVRMTAAERAKLTLVSDDATALKLLVDTTTFDNETVELINSDTVTWTVQAPNQIKADLTFPASAAHAHFYDRTPVQVDVDDFANWKTTSVATPFVEGTLRVYINGIRVSETGSVYVPNFANPPATWALTTFTPDPEAGTFELNREIAASDIIRIDFDTSLV
jgi:hypothetical protein